MLTVLCTFTILYITNKLYSSLKELSFRQSGHQWGSPKPPVKSTGPTSGNWTAPASVIPVAPGAVPSNPAWSASPQHGFPQMVSFSKTAHTH